MSLMPCLLQHALLLSLPFKLLPWDHFEVGPEVGSAFILLEAQLWRGCLEPSSRRAPRTRWCPTAVLAGLLPASAGSSLALQPSSTGFQREGQATVAQFSEVRLLLHLCQACISSAKRVPLFCSSCNNT